MALVPCFLNTRSGSAAAAREQLAASGVLDLRPVEPERLPREVERALAAGVPRVAVCGGDGTIACAAAVVSRAGAELAVIPGGTLNHFAGHVGVPKDLGEAAHLAATGTCVRRVDVGWLNGERLVLNTSSLGAYVSFVRTRERLERWFDYYSASLAAAVRTLFAVRGFEVEISVDGGTCRYDTTLVFVGIGEREAPLRESARLPEGRRGLHVMVAQADARFHLPRFAVAAARRSQVGEGREGAFDSFVTDRCVVRGRRSRGTVAVDGELVRITGPVTYELQRDALKVVAPEPPQ